MDWSVEIEMAPEMGAVTRLEKEELAEKLAEVLQERAAVVGVDPNGRISIRLAIANGDGPWAYEVTLDTALRIVRDHLNVNAWRIGRIEVVRMDWIEE